MTSSPGKNGGSLLSLSSCSLGRHQLDFAGLDLGIAGRLVAQLHQPVTASTYSLRSASARSCTRGSFLVEDNLGDARSGRAGR